MTKTNYSPENDTAGINRNVSLFENVVGGHLFRRNVLNYATLMIFSVLEF